EEKPADGARSDRDGALESTARARKPRTVERRPPRWRRRYLSRARRSLLSIARRSSRAEAAAESAAALTRDAICRRTTVVGIPAPVRRRRRAGLARLCAHAGQTAARQPHGSFCAARSYADRADRHPVA